MGFFLLNHQDQCFWGSMTIVFLMIAKHRSSDAMFAMYRWSLASGDQLAGRRPWSASWQQHTRWSNWRQLVLIDIWSSLTDIPSEVQTFFEMVGLETLTHFFFVFAGTALGLAVAVLEFPSNALGGNFKHIFNKKVISYRNDLAREKSLDSKFYFFPLK